jgi:hypothetical protein
MTVNNSIGGFCSADPNSRPSQSTSRNANLFNPSLKRIISGFGSAFLLLQSAQAGTFNNNFNADPVAAGQAVLNGSAAFVASGGVGGSGYISITDAVGSLQGSIVLPDLDANQPIGGFLMQFKLRIGGGSARPADGLSINFGPEVDDASNPAEEGIGTGVIFSFDTYDNDGADTAPAIEVKVGGNAVANTVATATMAGLRAANRPPSQPLTLGTNGLPVPLDTGANFVDVRIELKDGLLSLAYAGNPIFSGVPVLLPPTAGRFVIGARTGGETEAHWIDDLQITTYPPSTTPTITGFTGTPLGVIIRVTDATTVLNTNSITLSFDGTAITPQISKSGNVTTIRYSSSSVFATGSTHTASITFSDNGSPVSTKTANLAFTVPNFIAIPAEYATAAGAVDKTKPGFRIRPYETEANNPNSMNWTEDQLAGLKGENLANLAGADANGFFDRETVVNFDIAGGAGNFLTDEQFPGLPGTATRDAGTGNAAMEIQTFLEFPAAGSYTMGVNSDDGFRVSTAKNFDRLGLRLGEFDAPGGRAAADTLFTIVVPQAGIYPFRLVWQNGGGGANLEWFTVDDTGTKVLINDTNTPTAIRAYREGPKPPFVKLLSPAPGAVLIPTTNAVSITLGNGTTTVQTNSIKLSVNGQAVTPTITKPAGSTDTVVSYSPAGGFTRAIQTIQLVYGDSASPQNLITNQFTFSTEEQLLVGINDTQMWRYENNGNDLGTAWKEKNFDDSGWLNQNGEPAIGAALLAAETGATADTIRTVLSRSGPNGQIITDYFRTHFNFTADPTTTRLILRLIVDDSVVVYLNGFEIQRLRVPANQNFQTLGGDHENSLEGPFVVSAASLVQGDNVIAAEVHNVSAGSSDIVFGLQLSFRTEIETNAPTIVRAVEGSAADTFILSFSEPISLASGTNIANYSIAPVAGGATLAVTAAAITAGTNVTLTTAPRTAGTFYAVSVSNVRDIAGNIVSPNPTRITAERIKVLVGINETQMWRYENNGRDLGTAWKEKNFDDTGWLNQAGEPALGAALLAAETGGTAEPIRTVLVRTSPEGTQIVTDYFRTRFTFSDDLASTRLLLRYVVDDSAVVYLNGTEVHRLRVPVGQNFQTLGTDHENSYEGPFEIPISSLVVGENVLAAEVHQASTGSSDIVFGLELSAQISTGGTTPTRPTATISRNGAQITISSSDGGTVQASDSLDNQNWTNVGGAPQTISTAGTKRFFRIVK